MKAKKNIFNRIKDAILNEPKKEVEANFFNNGKRNHVLSFSYSGEKNLGEAGPVIDYSLDYDLLRYRSWQAQIESDVCKTIINRFVTWVIGEGLKLQCEPAEIVLNLEGISIDKYKFSTNTEARYSLFKQSLKSDYSEMKKLDNLAFTAKRNAIVGGDVLVILRWDGSNITTQLIDGCHVQSPVIGNEYMPAILPNGNRLVNGIEIDKKGKHVAFHVNTTPNEFMPTFERIPARSKQSGLQTAYMIYGSEHRLNNVRGLPLLAACIETAKKMERYKEAVLGSAEEVAKIVYQVVHQVYSDGSNPMMDQIAQMSGFDSDKPEMTVDAQGQAIADKVGVTTNKMALNMPKGAELKAIKHESTTQFKDFYNVNSKLLCSTVGIPYAVAFSDYDGSYSSSRAAIKDWEHTLNVERNNFGNDFYQKHYEFWLDVQILLGKVYAPGYILAKKQEDEVILSAYRKTRWVGAQVPHIDPVKEVMAERLKLGTAAAHIPLTTVEASTERVDGGEAPSNIVQFAMELDKAKQLGIDPVQNGIIDKTPTE